jgi:hypothetical protein
VAVSTDFCTDWKEIGDSPSVRDSPALLCGNKTNLFLRSGVTLTLESSMAILSGAIYEQYYFQRGTKTTRDKDDGLLYKMALFLAATSLAESARLLLLPAVTVSE